MYAGMCMSVMCMCVCIVVIIVFSNEITLEMIDSDIQDTNYSISINLLRMSR